MVLLLHAGAHLQPAGSARCHTPEGAGVWRRGELVWTSKRRGQHPALQMPINLVCSPSDLQATPLVSRRGCNPSGRHKEKLLRPGIRGQCPERRGAS